MAPQAENISSKSQDIVEKVRQETKEKRRLANEEYEKMKSEAPFLAYNYSEHFNELLDMYKSEQFVCESEKAIEAFALVKEMTYKKWKTCNDLMNCLNMMYKELETKAPHELTPLNFIMRWRKLLLDEYMSAIEPHFEVGRRGQAGYFVDEVQMVYNAGAVALPPMPVQAPVDKVAARVRQGMAEIAQEMTEEIDKFFQKIMDNGVALVEGQEQNVLTFSYSLMMSDILKKIKSKANVYVMETQPFGRGYLMLDALSPYSHLTPTLTADTSAAEVLQRTKALLMLPALAVLPDASVVTACGGTALAMHAHSNGNKVYVVAPNFVFCSSKEKFKSPLYDNRPFVTNKTHADGFESFKLDVVEAKYISMFITNQGNFAPSAVGEIYHSCYGSQFVQLAEKRVR